MRPTFGTLEDLGRCERVSPGNAARKWLKALLARGPMMAKDVRSLAVMHGFRKTTIYKAVGRLGIVKRRLTLGDQESTQWSLPVS